MSLPIFSMSFHPKISPVCVCAFIASAEGDAVGDLCAQL